MQLKKLEACINQYKEILAHPKTAGNHLYLWESQRIFQENWDIAAYDLKSMLDAALQNSQTRRLWNRENYEPKRILLAFSEMQPGFVRSMFEDLFNENKDIEGRVDRFVYYCDELLQLYKETYPHSIENNHFHKDDYQMISAYLAFMFPSSYTIYSYPGFINILKILGAKEIPRTNDFGRFVKVMRTISGFINKDDALLKLHHSRLDPKMHFMGNSMLLVYDFYMSFM